MITLFLEKSEKEIISIDANFLEQHHVDGIRFLYKLHKKKNPAAILNDPLGYGKKFQTVLFLEAVQRLQNKKVLILCKEGEEEKWLKMFTDRTKWDGEVVITNSEPYIKKNVLINPFCNLAKFAAMDWGTLVVDDDTVRKDLMKVNFKAEFKIWITSEDLKKSISKLTSIYNWLFSVNPKKDKCIIEFINNVTNELDKSIMLDAFVERFAIRRANLLNTTSKSKNQNLPEPPKVTRKNKDATGTKIKSSKRKVNSHNIDVKNKVSKTVSYDNKCNNSNGNLEQTLKMEISTNLPVYQESNEDYKLNKIHEQDSPSLLNIDDVEIRNNSSKIKTEENNGKNILNNNGEDMILDDQNNSRASNECPTINNDILQSKIELNEIEQLTKEPNHVKKVDKNNLIVKNEIIKKEENNSKSLKSDLDLKIKEFEERALSKFKGSFLDSIL